MKIFYGISSKKPLNTRLNCDMHICSCRCRGFIWVSQKLKLVYFETPKCGSTSIRRAFDINVAFSQLQFATAYIIHSQRYCHEQNNANEPLMAMHLSNGIYMTHEEFDAASLLATHNLSEGRHYSDPIGKFEFMNFFGSPKQAIDLFPGYRKFVVFRDPIDRLISTWNMFYNSDDILLRYRVLHCKNSAYEKNSLKYFIENIWKSPNHHIDSIGSFISSDILAKGEIEVVLFENLKSYWESIKMEYHLPPLGSFRVAKDYLLTDIEKSELLKNDKLLSYYSEDFKLMR